MIIVLQVAGIAAVLVGLVTIAFGIPVKEFSFGNTLILTGAIAACSGLMVLGLSVLAQELKVVGRRLASGAPRPGAEPRARAALPPFPAAAGAAGEGGPTFSRDQQGQSSAQVDPSVVPVASPWHEDPRARQEPPMAPEPPPASKPKRNLLFASNLRKDRQPPGAADASGPQPAVPAPDATPGSFEDAWPKADRGRAGETQRRGRPASTDPNTGAAAGRQPPPARSDEAGAVTVLKSGVVDGMAYSLYSDGSIEAQMPEGMMRFASIDALRAHLDQRS